MVLTPEQNAIMPGNRVLCFDPSLFKDDKKTPLTKTVKPGTVVKRYGTYNKFNHGNYPDLCDIKFDHKENISKGHFTDGLRVICRKCGSYTELWKDWELCLDSNCGYRFNLTVQKSPDDVNITVKK